MRLRNSNSSILLAFLVMIADLAAYYLSLFLAYQLRLLSEMLSFVVVLEFSFSYFLALWWLPATFIFFQLANGLYWRRSPFWIESGRVLRSLVFAFFVIFSFVSLAQLSASVSRLMLCFLFAFLFPCVLVSRGFAKRLLFKIPMFQERALIAGDAARLPDICRAFEHTPYMGISIVAELAADSDIKKAEKLINAHNISMAILVAPQTQPEQSQALFHAIHTKVQNLIYVPVSDAMDMTTAETGQLLQDQLGYLTVNRALAVPYNRILKRCFDLLLAIALLLPVLMITAVLTLAIRLTSNGAAIFRQERVGRDGRKFKVYKLRSMYHDASERLAAMLAADPTLREEWKREYKLKNDPRVTPLGKFLRRSSLDELPQILNVLKGEMSMVGPRPVLQEEIDSYYKENAIYYKMAQPGLTGLWQVSGRSDTSYAERISMDNWYVCNWSLWLDVVLLLSTPVAVLRGRGAY